MSGLRSSTESRRFWIRPSSWLRACPVKCSRARRISLRIASWRYSLWGKSVLSFYSDNIKKNIQQISSRKRKLTKLHSYLEWMWTLSSNLTSRSTKGVSRDSNLKLEWRKSLIPLISVASQANTLPCGDTM